MRRRALGTANAWARKRPGNKTLGSRRDREAVRAARHGTGADRGKDAWRDRNGLEGAREGGARNASREERAGAWSASEVRGMERGGNRRFHGSGRRGAADGERHGGDRGRRRSGARGAAALVDAQAMARRFDLGMGGEVGRGRGSRERGRRREGDRSVDRAIAALRGAVVEAGRRRRGGAMRGCGTRRTSRSRQRRRTRAGVSHAGREFRHGASARSVVTVQVSVDRRRRRCGHAGDASRAGSMRRGRSARGNRERRQRQEREKCRNVRAHGAHEMRSRAARQGEMWRPDGENIASDRIHGAQNRTLQGRDNSRRAMRR
jgi:hypothetical protein